MRLTVDVEEVAVHNGFGVRAGALGLTGGGPTIDDAREGLQESIAAWCAGLRLADELEDALNRRGLAWSPEGTGVSVVLSDIAGEMSGEWFGGGEGPDPAGTVTA